MPTDLGGRRKSLSAAISIANGSVEQFGIVVDATFGEVEAGRVCGEVFRRYAKHASFWRR